jgi:hypothetical protein
MFVRVYVGSANRSTSSPKGGAMSTRFRPVVCPESGCGFSNAVIAENTIIDCTSGHPELKHLRVRCGGCSKTIPVTTGEGLQLAHELDFGVRLWNEVRPDVVEMFADRERHRVS